MHKRKCYGKNYMIFARTRVHKAYYTCHNPPRSHIFRFPNLTVWPFSWLTNTLTVHVSSSNCVNPSRPLTCSLFILFNYFGNGFKSQHSLKYTNLLKPNMIGIYIIHIQKYLPIHVNKTINKRICRPKNQY